jgi:hypothetical protein
MTSIIIYTITTQIVAVNNTNCDPRCCKTSVKRFIRIMRLNNWKKLKSISFYIHTYIPLTLYPRRGSRGISDIAPRPTFYQNYLAVRNTADVTGGKPIAVWSQSISGVNAINPIVALYDIHGRKSEVLFFYFVPDTTRPPFLLTG